MSTDETAPDFAVVMRGYDRTQVDRHLGRTTTRITELRERVTRLERELAEERARVRVDPPADAEALSASERFSVLGEETTRILVAAEESAREMRERANRQAEAELAAAERAARDRAERASEHAARILADAEARREEVLAEMRAGVADAEAELDRLEGVRRDLVSALRVAVEATTASVEELEDASIAEPPAVTVADPVSTDEAAGAEPAEDAEPVTGEDDAAGSGAADTAGVAADEGGADDVEPVGVVVTEPDDGGDGAASDDEDPEEASPGAGIDAEVATAGEDATTGEEDATVEEAAPVEEDEGEEDEEQAAADASSAAADGGTAGDGPRGGTGERHGAAPAALRTAISDAVAASTAVPESSTDDTPPDRRREEALAGVRPGTLRRLRRGLQDLQNGVLQRVRERSGGDAESLLPGDEAATVLADVAAPFLDGAYRAGVGDAAALAGAPAPDDVASARAVVTDASDALGRELLDELRTTLLPSLRAGIEADEADASLSERVGEVFRDLKGPVVETVVDRHLTAAYGRATLDTWRLQDVARIVWVLGEESRCPEGKCRTNAAEGPVAPGQEFPSGDVLPLVHDGCTCALAPVTTAA